VGRKTKGSKYERASLEGGGKGGKNVDPAKRRRTVRTRVKVKGRLEGKGEWQSRRQGVKS